MLKDLCLVYKACCKTTLAYNLIAYKVTNLLTLRGRKFRFNNLDSRSFLLLVL